MRPRDIAHVRRLLHQFFIDMNAARRVEQHDVIATELACLDRTRRNLLRRLAKALPEEPMKVVLAEVRHPGDL